MIEAISGLHWLRPLWLWALLALPLLWFAWRARRKRESVWRRAVDPHLLPHLLERGGPAARGQRVADPEPRDVLQPGDDVADLTGGERVDRRPRG